MKKKLPISLILTAMMALSCSAQIKAGLVILNGKVFTSDTSCIYVEAIAIKGDIIIETGKTCDIEKLIDQETKVINANGRLVLPGFNDAHAHFGPVDPDFIELRYTTDKLVIKEKVKSQVLKSKKDELIMGGHWDHEMFTDREWPVKELIDSVSPDNPVVLERTDGHSMLVNSFVLNASQITKDTPNPYGGEIVKDPVTGEPTGILKESAMNLVVYGDVKVKRTPEEAEKLNWNGYILALQQAAEYGITSIQIPGEADFDMYERIESEGLLTARLDIGGTLTSNAGKLRKYDSLRKKFPPSGNWLRFGYLKGFMDGTLGSATAMMYEPFNDEPDKTGLPQMTFEEMEKQVLAADSKGFQIGIHAIGPKANTWILNAFQKAAEVNGLRDRRHRSEHAQILIAPDIKRFALLGVIPSMQPTHCITDKNFAEKRIGADRCLGAYAWKSLAENGAMLAFGTDYPVEPINPMEGLYAAVTRKDRKGEEGNGWFPQEKITMEEAIRYYTLGSAYAQFMEDRKGMIRQGYLADIVILNADIFVIPETEIMTTKIDYTIVGGKIVFERK